MGIRDVFEAVASKNISKFYLITHTQQSVGFFVIGGFIFQSIWWWDRKFLEELGEYCVCCSSGVVRSQIINNHCIDYIGHTYNCLALKRFQQPSSSQFRKMTRQNKKMWTRICCLKFQKQQTCFLIPTSNGSWCMGIKGEMSGTVCLTFTWDMYTYMSCLKPLFLLLFVHYCNLMEYVVFWVGKWQSRGSTGMFGNLMAIYHIMLQFIQNHSRFVMLMIWK